MNTLFLTAITGECCLFTLHGIHPRYNPFSLLRKQLKKEGVKLSNSHKECLLFLRELYKTNGMEEHKLLATALAKFDKHEVTKEV